VVSADGKFSYSSIRIIRLTSATEDEMAMLTYPNPVKKDLRIVLPVNWQGKLVQLELFSFDGQLMRTIQNTHASQIESLDIGRLAPGIYLLKTSCNGELRRRKIIKE
jgi:hypothetical protein